MFGFNLGPMELGIIAAVALIIFGPRQLPKLGKSFGQAIAEVRKIPRYVNGELDAADKDEPDA